MMPEDDATVTTRPETRWGRRWYRPARCSICTSFIWSHPIRMKEPLEAPEPRREWMLCGPCHNVLLQELGRSTIRSPKAYMNEVQTFQREFAWFAWAIILFGLLHVAIFIILLAVPR